MDVSVLKPCGLSAELPEHLLDITFREAKVEVQYCTRRGQIEERLLYNITAVLWCARTLLSCRHAHAHAQSDGGAGGAGRSYKGGDATVPWVLSFER